MENKIHDDDYKDDLVFSIVAHLLFFYFDLRERGIKKIKSIYSLQLNWNLSFLSCYLSLSLSPELNSKFFSLSLNFLKIDNRFFRNHVNKCSFFSICVEITRLLLNFVDPNFFSSSKNNVLKNFKVVSSSIRNQFFFLDLNLDHTSLSLINEKLKTENRRIRNLKEKREEQTKMRWKCNLLMK